MPTLVLNSPIPSSITPITTVSPDDLDIVTAIVKVLPDNFIVKTSIYFMFITFYTIMTVAGVPITNTLGISKTMNSIVCTGSTDVLNLATATATTI